jgi:hypothetical protein
LIAKPQRGNDHAAALSQMNECLSRAEACRWRAAITNDPDIRATNLDRAHDAPPKRAKLSRPSGQWQNEDYDVLADGKVVGRILQKITSGPPELRWFWSVAGAACPGTGDTGCDQRHRGDARGGDEDGRR